MPNIATPEAVDQVSLTVSYATSLDAPPHDVFVLEGRINNSASRFDARRLLDMILPALGRSDTDSLTVRVCYTHRLGPEPLAEAEIAIALTTSGAVPTGDRQSVATAFRAILGLMDGEAPRLGHDAALPAARARVARAYPAVPASALQVSAEEHVHDVWSIGLTDPALDRYEVDIGFVDEHSSTTHIRHRPAREVVDSVGTG